MSNGITFDAKVGRDGSIILSLYQGPKLIKILSGHSKRVLASLAQKCLEKEGLSGGTIAAVVSSIEKM